MSEQDRTLAVYAGNWLHDDACEATISVAYDGPTMTRYMRSGELCRCQVRHAEKFFAKARLGGVRLGLEAAAKRLGYCDDAAAIRAIDPERVAEGKP